MNVIAFKQRIAVNIEFPNEILDNEPARGSLYPRFRVTSCNSPAKDGLRTTEANNCWGATGRDLAEVRELIPNQLAQTGALLNEESIA